MSEIDVLAGIVGSDGHITKDLLTTFVINKDLEFMEHVVNPLLHLATGKMPNKPKFVGSGFGNGKFKTYVCSRKLCKELVAKYNIPAGAKSMSIKPPIGLLPAEEIDFLSGWIAGDGSVTKDRTRTKIEIWSKSKPMMLWFKKVLLKNGIQSRMFFEKNKEEHILRIGRKEDVFLFYKKIRIPHPEKQAKLENYCNSSWPSSN